MSSNDVYGHSVDTVASHVEEEEPFESLEEIEAHTIGNLLPDDDDLLSGHEHVAQPSREDEIEDLDLFSSVGGIDLGDDVSSAGKKRPDFLGNSNSQLGVSTPIGEHPFSECPSRTLFVRNINTNVEDSELQALFEQYGDIRTLYTACRHRGFVMISYYDIRAACNAMKALKNKPLRHRTLDIHYSIPKDNLSEKDINQGTLVIFNLDPTVSNDDLLQIFGAHGEIKEIRETLDKSDKKFIEFYDVRAANEALHALNQSDIAGKKIKLQPSRSGGARCSTQLPSLELADEPGLLVQGSSSGFSLGPINTGILESETGLGLNAGIRAAVPPLMQSSSLHWISSSVPTGLSSVLRAELLCNQPGISETQNSLSQVQCDSQGLAILHPHSLPEYSRGLANIAPCNSNTDLPAKFSSLQLEGVETPYLRSMNPSIEIGIAGNTRGHFGGRHYMWSNSNHLHSLAFGWRDSSLLANGLFTPQPQAQLHGVERSPSCFFNSAIPLNGSHVGSGLAVNPSIWDGQNSYPSGSPEASVFHQGSFSSMRLSGSHLHQMDFASHNMPLHVGGTCMDLPFSSSNVGLPSYRQRCMMHPTKGQMSVGCSFESTSERIRGCRSESSSTSGGNKKQYELDIDRIRRGEDNRTTLMIKNIPNKYNSKMLMAAIDENHRGTYDFIYLPIDFKNKCNVGYAFINMVDSNHIISIYETFNGKKWEKFNSEKVASLAYARIQGKAALIAHFQNSSLMNDDKRCRPILFHSDGPNAGNQVPFPMGVNIRSRPGRSKSSCNDDNHQEDAHGLTGMEESFTED